MEAMPKLDETIEKWRKRAIYTGLKWRDLPLKMNVMDRLALLFLDSERVLEWDRKGDRYRGR